MDGCWICFGVFCMCIAISAISKFLWRTDINYKYGTYDFSPFGSFIILGRDGETGQLIKIERIYNKYKTEQDSWHHKVLIFEFASEADWIAAAIIRARLWMANQDSTDISEHKIRTYPIVMVKYYHCISTQIDDMVRDQVIWRNGRFIN